jgi:hypothetical protein
MPTTTRLITRKVALAMTVAAAAGAAQANLLANASFENGTFSPPSNQTESLAVGSAAITGWTVIGDTTAWIGTGNPWSVTASDGARFLDLTDYSAGAPFGGVRQTVSTAVGGLYTLSFDLGSSNLYGRPSAITALAVGTTATFTSPLTGGEASTTGSACRCRSLPQQVRPRST